MPHGTSKWTFGSVWHGRGRDSKSLIKMLLIQSVRPNVKASDTIMINETIGFLYVNILPIIMAMYSHQIFRSSVINGMTLSKIGLARELLIK